MGDVAMTVPVIAALLQQNPGLRITVVSRPFFKPLFDGIPNLEFFAADVKKEYKGILGLRSLAGVLAKKDIDAIADLHNVIRSKVVTAILKLKGIPAETIDKGRSEKAALTRANGGTIKPLRTTHERYADVFRNLGFEVNLERYSAVKSENLSWPDVFPKGDVAHKRIGLAPFAAYEGKSYPKERLQELLSVLDRERDVDVFLYGGGKDEAIQLTELARPYKNVYNLANIGSFQQELRSIQLLDLMISMDSGNGHLAAVYGIPVLTLWGVTHPYAGFAPFQQPALNQLCVNREKYPLIPTAIYGNKYPEAYKNCLEDIAVETIVHRAMEILNQTSS